MTSEEARGASPGRQEGIIEAPKCHFLVISGQEDSSYAGTVYAKLCSSFWCGKWHFAVCFEVKTTAAILIIGNK
jgi:hypothetical protein